MTVDDLIDILKTFDGNSQVITSYDLGITYDLETRCVFQSHGRLYIYSGTESDAEYTREKFYKRVFPDTRPVAGT